MEDCFLCQKHKGIINLDGLKIYEDEHVFIYHLDPKEGQVYLGYIFIELKRHIGGLEDMNDEEACAVGRMLQRVSFVYKNNFDIEHIYSHVIGNNIPHLHIHIIPRYKGAPREFWGLKTDEWEGAPHGGREKVEEFCTSLGQRLSKVCKS
jgi:Diadenosine tetraphosphate (Ap4A) hydrolase and other HIT family hydrolases